MRASAWQWATTAEYFASGLWEHFDFPFLAKTLSDGEWHASTRRSSVAGRREVRLLRAGLIVDNGLPLGERKIRITDAGMRLLTEARDAEEAEQRKGPIGWMGLLPHEEP